jgi:hypothetical protein
MEEIGDAGRSRATGKKVEAGNFSAPHQTLTGIIFDGGPLS